MTRSKSGDSEQFVIVNRERFEVLESVADSKWGQSAGGGWIDLAPIRASGVEGCLGTTSEQSSEMTTRSLNGLLFSRQCSSTQLVVK